MSYTFLLEQGEESSAESFSAIPASVLSRLNLTAEKSCCNASGTESCPSSQSGTMCEHSTGSRGVERSIACAVDSHVRTSALSEQEKVLTESTADCGQKWQESFAKLDRVSSMWKTRQLSLFGGLAPFSETWPLWGTMRRGECFRLAMLEHDTSVKECGSMPIPCRYGNGGTGGTAKLKSLGIDRCKINPNQQEWLMMWPQGWTELTPLETDRFQRWQQAHSAFFLGA